MEQTFHKRAVDIPRQRLFLTLRKKAIAEYKYLWHPYFKGVYVITCASWYYALCMQMSGEMFLSWTLFTRVQTVKLGSSTIYVYIIIHVVSPRFCIKTALTHAQEVAVLERISRGLVLAQFCPTFRKEQLELCRVFRWIPFCNNRILQTRNCLRIGAGNFTRIDVSSTAVVQLNKYPHLCRPPFEAALLLIIFVAVCLLQMVVTLLWKLMVPTLRRKLCRGVMTYPMNIT